MIEVQQVPVGRHPLLCRVLDLLERPWLTVLETHGNFDVDFLAGPPATNRVDKAPRWLAPLGQLGVIVRNMIPREPGWKAQCANYFPPGGGLSWHTNSSRPGWRVYIPYPLAPAGQAVQSGFVLPGFRRIDDRHGFANVFRIDEDWREDWHAVQAVTGRRCAGFEAPEAFVRALGVDVTVGVRFPSEAPTPPAVPR